MVQTNVAAAVTPQKVSSTEIEILTVGQVKVAPEKLKGRRLGHSNPTITLGAYGHLFANTDDRAAQIIEAAFGSGTGTVRE